MFKDELYKFITGSSTGKSYNDYVEWSRLHGTLRVRKNRKGQVEINLSGNDSWVEPRVWADNHELMLSDQLETCLRRYMRCVGEEQLSRYVFSRLHLQIFEADCLKSALVPEDIYIEGVRDGMIHNQEYLEFIKTLPQEGKREMKIQFVKRLFRSHDWHSFLKERV